MQRLLVKNQSKFFTYTLPVEKITSLVIGGLGHTYSSQEITKDLKAGSISSVSVKTIVTTKAKVEGRRMILWLITFNATFGVDNLTPIKKADHE